MARLKRFPGGSLALLILVDHLSGDQPLEGVQRDSPLEGSCCEGISRYNDPAGGRQPSVTIRSHNDLDSLSPAEDRDVDRDDLTCASIRNRITGIDLRLIVSHR